MASFRLRDEDPKRGMVSSRPRDEDPSWVSKRSVIQMRDRSLGDESHLRGGECDRPGQSTGGYEGQSVDLSPASPRVPIQSDCA